MVDGILAALGNKVEFRQAAVEKIEKTGAGFRIRVAGDWIEGDRVIVACEAHNAAKLLDGRLSELLAGIGYSSSMVVAFAFGGSPPMPGFGFLVPAKERRRIVACTWLGVKFPHLAPAEKSIARCFLAGEEEPDIDAVYRELCDLSGLRAKPHFQRLWRWPRAMAQYEVGHAARIAEIHSLVSQMPGLCLAGNAYNGIGIPDCIRSGKQAAESILRCA
jgi:oxygen-dependent protoporphyrinogen oxidase